MDWIEKVIDFLPRKYILSVIITSCLIIIFVPKVYPHFSRVLGAFILMLLLHATVRLIIKIWRNDNDKYKK
ncbi:MAG TPA: hypothetical protein DG048_17710 [Pseudoalteromonas sp.]|nr:hypothetical protein [Pseudoalteromonas sp.]